MTTLKELLDSNKIDIYEYDTYLLFDGTDLGREYLAKKLESICLDMPMEANPLEIMHKDGRRSEGRDIKFLIIKVNKLMETE